MRGALVLLVLVLGTLPASAFAADATGGSGAELLIEKATGNRSPLGLAGQRLRIRVVVAEYVPGQTVTVRVQRGASKLRVKQLAIQPAAEGRGQAVLGFTPRSTGRLRVRASHVGTPEMATFVAPERSVPVGRPSAAPGDRGPSVRWLQRTLAERGYVVGQRGLYDARTARAVLAFRKVSGLPRTMAADRAVFRRLAKGGGTFRIRYPKHGRHVEADLGAQVMALIDKGRVRRIYPISSGSPVTPTVLGSYRVYRKDPGTNAQGMVYSSYFTGGYAIHGYASVPVFPASHGCLRTPVPEAISIYEWVRHGDGVDVYYRHGGKAAKRIADPGP